MSESRRDSAPLLTRLNRICPDPVRRRDPVQFGVFPPPRGGADPLSPGDEVDSIFLELVPDQVWRGPLDDPLEGWREVVIVGSPLVGIHYHYHRT